MCQNDFTKRIRGHFRALFFSVIVIFTLFLFFIPVASADYIGLEPAGFYRISFTDYQLGNLDGQWNWTNWYGNCGQIEQRGESYNQVLDLDLGTAGCGDYCFAEKNFLGLANNYDFLTIKLEVPDCPASADCFYSIILKDSNGDWFFLLNVNTNSETQATIIVETFDGGIILDENFDYAGDYNWFVELDKPAKKFRVKNDFSDWSNWFETKDHRNPDIDFLLIENGIGYGKTYIDEIFLEAKHCGPLNCELCDTKYGCDYVDECIWNLENDTCETRGAFTQCGEGINLIFCETQEECETFGGNWINDRCWEKPGLPLIDFEAFYNDKSDFDEPTSLALGIVGFVNPIFKTAGNIITTFEDKFNLAEAYSYGFMFGEVIPKARGFMGTINDFFGGLPVGETFLIFLLVSLVVIVVRIIFKIVGLIKP